VSLASSTDLITAKSMTVRHPNLLTGLTTKCVQTHSAVLVTYLYTSNK